MGLDLDAALAYRAAYGHVRAIVDAERYSP